MKGIGNYRQIQAAPVVSTERRRAQLVLITGPRASIRFVDGMTYAMPYEPLKKLGLVAGDVFMIITEYRGREPHVRVERIAEARETQPVAPKTGPKVMVRNGLKLTTRR